MVPPSSYGLTYPASATERSNLTSSSFPTASQSSYRTPQTSVLSDTTLCYSCGSDGHKARHCDQPKKCFHCGDTGHLLKGCAGVGHRGDDGGRFERWEARSRKLGQFLKVQSIFEREHGSMVAAMKAAGVEEPTAGRNDEECGGGVVVATELDLIDLTSTASEASSDEYDTSRTRLAKPPTKEQQLYAKVLQGYSVQRPAESKIIDLAEPSLLDAPSDGAGIKNEGDSAGGEGEDEKISVALHHKRKGKAKKGRGATYDLTPFLSY